VRRLSVGVPAPPWRDLGDGTIELDLEAGDDVVITTQGTSPRLRIDPVAGLGTGNVWGLP
jgi:hypothetical protein